MVEDSKFHEIMYSNYNTEEIWELISCCWFHYYSNLTYSVQNLFLETLYSVYMIIFCPTKFHLFLSYCPFFISILVPCSSQSPLQLVTVLKLKIFSLKYISKSIWKKMHWWILYWGFYLLVWKHCFETFLYIPEII
jgi:hypothetical protein